MYLLTEKTSYLLDSVNACASVSNTATRKSFREVDFLVLPTHFMNLVKIQMFLKPELIKKAFMSNL